MPHNIFFTISDVSINSGVIISIILEISSDEFSDFKKKL